MHGDRASAGRPWGDDTLLRNPTLRVNLIRLGYAAKPARSVGRRLLSALTIGLTLGTSVMAAGPVAKNLDIRTSPATGVATFVTATGGGPIRMQPRPGIAQPQPLDFFSEYGPVFGVTSPQTQLRLGKAVTDRLQNTHTTFEQIHDGVPVFGAQLRVHTDPQGRVTAVNGTFVPNIKVSVVPTITPAAAGSIAMQAVQKQKQPATPLRIAANDLFVFRTNLARRVPGENHLIRRVEVTNDVDVREFVMVDAHNGRIVDQVTGIHDAIGRRVYEGSLSGVTLIWTEGDALPFGNADVDGIIDATEDIYNLVAGVSGGTFLSWDGFDGLMRAVNNSSSLSCPNANWNGAFTNFCLGVTSDDVVAHEWSHAYTQSTHDLIYQWQSGALNESYSDIFGEIVDILNGAGTDSPDVVRSPGDCSLLGGSPPPEFEINTPASIGGLYPVGGAQFNPSPPVTVTANVEFVNDGDDEAGAGSVTDACQALIGFTPGNIALIDRGQCSFVIKVNNAAAAGAVGVVVVNNQGDSVMGMGGTGPVTIPSVFIGQSNGSIIKNELLSTTVNADIRLLASSVNSIRWLVGEDSTAFGGSIRDMWNPNCFGDPGKVTDASFYQCGPADSDSGGVHTNSGIPNHGFALLVDGGTYNGKTIPALGLTKATHLYWRAESVYQTPFSGFADHADALEQSCTDLIGQTLTAVSTSTPVPVNSTEVFTPADCTAVADLVAAIELRTDPTFCNFTTLLAPNPPDPCSGTPTNSMLSQDWEAGLAGWTMGTRSVINPATFDTADWAIVGTIPAGRSGSAMFVADPVLGDCGADDETGALFLDSPVISIPLTVVEPRVKFDHWTATEAGFDGGNVKLSVNGGAFAVIPSSAFNFNPYNTTLITAGGGNTNPLGGEEAFSGADGGSNSGSWGQSQIDLTGLVSGGDDIRIRFELGMDGCNGVAGWYVDDVSVYFCAPPCTVNADCDDGSICTFDECVASVCANTPNIYGDVDKNGTVNLFDLFCILDGFSGIFTGNCTFDRMDLEPCSGNATLNLFDLFAVLDVFKGIDPCCGP